MIKSLYPQFQRWSEHGAIWIISDPHFDDEDCKIINPDWPSSEEYIKKIKPYISKNDTLICLGDVGNKEYFKRFNCYKVLLTGNHDAGATTYADVFDEVYDGPLFIADRILLSHEPIEGVDKICVNIHGHIHGGYFIESTRINLAADVIGWAPFNLGIAIRSGLLSNIKNYHRLTLEKIKKS